MTYDGEDKKIKYLYQHRDIEDISDVILSSLEDGDVLKYDSSTQKWVNGAEQSIPVNDVHVDGASVVSSGVAEIDLSGKQDTLTPGSNIQIDGSGVISATDTTYNDFVGSTSQQAGSSGLVPAPTTLDIDKFLKGDGTWGEAGGGNVDDVQMNGVSIVDANKIASFNNYVELTQAQYDALPASKLTDGILYCIKDSGIVEGDKYAPIIYSLEEREVGVWTDGKPLYQKTFHNIPVNTQLLTNIDKLVDYKIKRHGLGNTSSIIDIGDGFQVTDSALCILNNNTVTYICWTGTQGNVDKTADDITLWYTKTTDVPGSGTWGTDGVPMVHYDGTERIIGTWFGETLYQRTFRGSLTPSASSDTIFNLSDYDIGEIIQADGYIKRASMYGFCLQIGSYLNGSLTSAWYKSAGDDFLIYHSTAGEFDTYVITVRYTKTT